MSHRINRLISNRISRHWLLLTVVEGVFFVIALIYAWATPSFEASDELWHMGMIQHIVETGELPVQVAGVHTIYEQEGSQPPLYYLLAAALVLPLEPQRFEHPAPTLTHTPSLAVRGNIGNQNLRVPDTPAPAPARCGPGG